QAFAQRARADAYGVELLDAAQHREDLVLVGDDVRGQGFGDGGQWFAQVAVLVQRVDQQHADGEVACAEVGQVQLPQQVVGEGVGLGDALGGAAVVVIVERAAVAAAPVGVGGGRL